MERFDNIIVTIGSLVIIALCFTLVYLLTLDVPRPTINDRVNILEHRCDSLQRQIDYMVE